MIKELPSTIETGPDDNNIFTRTEFKFNEKNEIVKVIKKIKRYTVYSRHYKSVTYRKDNWVKFGLAKGDNNVTFLSDELVFMEAPPIPSSLKSSKTIIPNVFTEEKEIIEHICKICNGNHWSRICPSQNGSNVVEEKPKVEYKSKVEYKPSDKRKNLFTLQITELSKDINEFDLYKIFSCICKIKNILLVRDYNTYESKGFAYIIFNEENDLNYALKLHHTGFCHLRLKLERVY